MIITVNVFCCYVRILRFVKALFRFTEALPIIYDLTLFYTGYFFTLFYTGGGEGAYLPPFLTFYGGLVKKKK